MGNIIINRKDGKKEMIENVLYVPGMCVGQLVDKGFSVIMKHDSLDLFDPSQKLVLRSPFSKNRSFHTIFSLTEVRCLTAIESEQESWLWH